jgi:hypothetical protein
MNRSRRANTEALRTFMRIATALWLAMAIYVFLVGDALMAISWSCFAAGGALIAGGLVHGSQRIAYLAVALFVVGVAISIGVFIVD